LADIFQMLWRSRFACRFIAAATLMMSRRLTDCDRDAMPTRLGSIPGPVAAGVSMREILDQIISNTVIYGERKSRLVQFSQRVNEDSPSKIRSAHRHDEGRRGLAVLQTKIRICVRDYDRQGRATLGRYMVGVLPSPRARQARGKVLGSFNKPEDAISQPIE